MTYEAAPFDEEAALRTRAALRSLIEEARGTEDLALMARLIAAIARDE